MPEPEEPKKTGNTSNGSVMCSPVVRNFLAPVGSGILGGISGGVLTVWGAGISAIPGAIGGATFATGATDAALNRKCDGQYNLEKASINAAASGIAQTVNVLTFGTGGAAAQVATRGFLQQALQQAPAAAARGAIHGGTYDLTKQGLELASGSRQKLDGLELVGSVAAGAVVGPVFGALSAYVVNRLQANQLLRPLQTNLPSPQVEMQIGHIGELADGRMVVVTERAGTGTPLYEMFVGKPGALTKVPGNVSLETYSDGSKVYSSGNFAANFAPSGSGFNGVDGRTLRLIPAEPDPSSLNSIALRLGIPLRGSPEAPPPVSIPTARPKPEAPRREPVQSAPAPQKAAQRPASQPSESTTGPARESTRAEQGASTPRTAEIGGADLPPTSLRAYGPYGRANDSVISSTGPGPHTVPVGAGLNLPLSESWETNGVMSCAVLVIKTPTRMISVHMNPNEQYPWRGNAKVESWLPQFVRKELGEATKDSEAFLFVQRPTGDLQNTTDRWGGGQLVDQSQFTGLLTKLGLKTARAVEMPVDDATLRFNASAPNQISVSGDPLSKGDPAHSVFKLGPGN